MNGLAAVQRLTAMGYQFQVEGDALRYEWHGSGKPDPSQVRPLLALVKEHKPEVLAYFSRPVPPERILTCYECCHFRPAANSPNPTQAWGHCRKRNTGRYGVAMACGAVLTSPDRPGEAICQKGKDNSMPC
jgi:hypothetical protein